MKIPLSALLLSAILALSRPSTAETIITVDHNEGTSADDAFHFQTVPTPRPGAALTAVFKVVDGAPDDDSASLDVLHDGKLPEQEDQPDASFFFHEDSDGGRLLVDLGKVIPIKEVDTYSRHPNARAPQVYKLYGSDGGGAGFVPEPKRPQDPAQGGWKLLATVDTRARFGQKGGQYGVSVADPTDGLGSYRYLLFDVTRTEDDDTYGNTFFSEIDVAEAIWMGATVEAVSQVLRAQLSLAPDSGLALNDVVADGPAAKAGLQTNDVLTRFNDQLLVRTTQLSTLLAAQHAGDTVRVSYVRRGQPGVAEVRLDSGKRPVNKEEAAAPPDKVTVTVDRNEGAAATGAFKFESVPSPRPSAALTASFRLEENADRPDNSPSPDLLHDGKLPEQEDQPGANFFFPEGSNGGILKIDLGKVVAIKGINTYSWHPSTRGPQIYTLYGRETDDEKSEWKLIADVDTRHKFGNVGGQYGVDVNAGDGIIGRYRYLRFDMDRTEDDDSYGNTFYSEIDVVDRDATAGATPAPTPLSL